MTRTARLREAQSKIWEALSIVSEHLNDLADECGGIEEAEKSLRSALRLVQREANWHEGR